MADAALRRRCQQRLDGLQLPMPFTLAAFVEGLAKSRGRPLVIVDLPSFEDGGPSGAWIATDGADYVFVDRAARSLHRQHIVLHELAHMVFDHREALALSRADAATLLPDISNKTVARILGRSRYTETEEREAELLATMIAQRVRRSRRPDADIDVHALRGRLQAALG
jgi:hypothetical protein